MRPAEKPERAEPNALRITMQYHSRKGMVYELEKAGLTLDVHVAPEQTGESFDATGQWLVGAQSSRDRNAVVITERAATRMEQCRPQAQYTEPRQPTPQRFHDGEVPRLFAVAIRDAYAGGCSAVGKPGGG